MYLCVCSAVSESMVIELIQSGCSNFNEISKETGLCAECGQCTFRAKKECERLFAEFGEHSQNRNQILAMQTINNLHTPRTKSECA